MPTLSFRYFFRLFPFFPFSLLCLILWLHVLSLAVAAQEDYRVGLLRVVERLEAFFPRVEGVVVTAEHKQVYLDLGTATGVRPGMELSVFREGDEFKHPLTGQVLGRLEEDVGMIKVIEVRENYSIAEIMEVGKGQAIRIGDKCRITSGPIRLGFLPILNTSSIGFNQEIFLSFLHDRIKETRRFDVFDPNQTMVWLLERGIELQALATPAGLAKIKDRFPVNYLLFTQVEQLEGRLVLHARLLSTSVGAVEELTSIIIQDPAALQQYAIQQPFQQPLVGGPSGSQSSVWDLRSQQPIWNVNRPLGGPLGAVQRSQRLEMQITGMAVGDVMGRGENNIVLSEPTSLSIYRWDGQQLQKLWDDGSKTTRNYLAVDVGDVNGNGIPEIFVTNLSFGTLSSFVLEYQGNTFQILWENVNRFFRVLPGAKRAPPLLLTQLLSRSPETPFLSTVSIYGWRGNTYERMEDLKLPKATSVYEVGISPGKGSNAPLLLVTPSGKLKLWQNGKSLWESNAFYTAPVVQFTYQREKTFDLITQSAIESRGYIRHRMVFMDGKEGVTEVLVTRPRSPGGVFGVNFGSSSAFRIGGPSNTQADLTLLQDDGVGLTEIGSITSIEGLVADYQLADVDGDGKPEIVVALQLSSGGVFSKPSSAVVFYPLPPNISAALR
jgi:hypothetical protein